MCVVAGDTSPQDQATPTAAAAAAAAASAIPAENLEVVVSLLGKQVADGLLSPSWQDRQASLLSLAEAVSARVKPASSSSPPKKYRQASAQSLPPWEALVGIVKHTLLDSCGQVIVSALDLLLCIIGSSSGFGVVGSGTLHSL